MIMGSNFVMRLPTILREMRECGSWESSRRCGPTLDDALADTPYTIVAAHYEATNLAHTASSITHALTFIMRRQTMKPILFVSLSLLLVAQTQAQLRPPREDAVSRFLRYVQINTQSEPEMSAIPSTKNQMQFARLLARELEGLGVTGVRVSEFGFVYATILGNLPSNSGVPAIGLIAHMDTNPIVSGSNVKPIVHENYGGSAIVLPGDSSQVITVEKNPILKEMIGDDIITADGTTLLGSDDKAGCATIWPATHQPCL
jgi:hypothetical protein